ncbi:MAG: TaqI-like C-terminal specificity domain-containing protein [Candidatus Saccharibacteria bacterium]
MARLFGKNKLRELVEKIDTESVRQYIDIVKEWSEDYHNGSLKKDKETSREQAYNRDFFIRILGYKEKPAVPYSLEPKATTDKGQLPDAVLSHTDASKHIKNISAVVELKGAATELDRPQRREGNMSPIQQAFKYKTQYRNCPFVIVCNFWEFRLYHDNQLDYELWTLDDLVNPEDDYILFKTWYALLRCEKFTASKGASKTEALLSDIRVEQDNISKKFYKVYREARLDLLRDIYKHNHHIRSKIDVGIEKAQKIVDRIVFAAFAEDRGLLPDNTLQRVIMAADSSAFGGSLWNTLKSFFEAIDVGSEKLEIPDGYNGGLFKHDDKLNNLQISDEPLRRVIELGSYNFADDLSVNILGHIFEQSISDLEEIKNKVNDSQNLETVAHSRRKKDGIYYTPDYIVRYIIDNSLGAYLREQEEKLKLEFRLKDNILDKTYEQREKQAYIKYYERLSNIKVLDPACGSGAFLVYVFDYLFAEHKRIGNILGLDKGVVDFGETYKNILTRNIYGVDLNDESVEITKLSLWLKTAQKGKKLTTLDANIKCGNSLIDDPNIADGKAFNWHEQFTDVLEQGGFDVIIGNPPWVSLGGRQGQKVSNEELKYYTEKYNGNTYLPNLFEYFVNLGVSILKQNGYFSMIVPDRFGINGVFNNLRKNIWQKYNLIQVVYKWDFPYVVTDTMTFVIKKQNIKNKVVAIKATPSSEFVKLTDEEIDKTTYEFKLFGSAETKALVNKIIKLGTPVSQIAKTTSGFGGKSKLVTSNREAIGQREILKGQSIGRYVIKHKLFFEFIDENITGRTRDKRKLGATPKVLLRKTGSEIIATYDNTGLYPEQSLYFLYSFTDNVQPLYLLAVLNSRLITWLYRSNFITNADSTPQLKNNDLDKFPIVIADKQTQSRVSQTVEELMSKSKSLYYITDTTNRLISSEFSLHNMPAKLNKWWTFDFVEFTNRLRLNLTLTQKDELLQLFEKYRPKLQSLDNEIQRLDHEIDRLVYKLYRLTDEEITMIERDTAK